MASNGTTPSELDRLIFIERELRDAMDSIQPNAPDNGKELDPWNASACVSRAIEEIMHLQDIINKDKIPKRSGIEDSMVRNALSFMKSTDGRWADARGQSGPAPSDFGDHAPIPEEAISEVTITPNKES